MSKSVTSTILPTLRPDEFQMPIAFTVTNPERHVRVAFTGIVRSSLIAGLSDDPFTKVSPFLLTDQM